MLNPSQPTGLSLANLIIYANEPDAPIVSLTLGVNHASEILSGKARVSHAKNPLLNIDAVISGKLISKQALPNRYSIVVSIRNTTAKYNWSNYGSKVRVLPKEFSATLVMDESWRVGTASYDYLDARGCRHAITDAPIVAALPKKN